MKANELKDITCYLVEDHPLIRSYLELILVKQFASQLVGSSDSAAVARQEIDRLRPDLVLADLSLRAGHGLELIKDLRALDHPPKVLVLSGHDEAAYAERAIHAGASGYVSKSAPPSELIQALTKILAGEVYLSPSMTQRVLNRASGFREEGTRTPIDLFSDRELEVFELMGSGFDTRQIAGHLGIDAKTVDTYRCRIKEKLGITSASNLRMAAFHWLNGQQLDPSPATAPLPASNPAI